VRLSDRKRAEGIAADTEKDMVVGTDEAGRKVAHKAAHKAVMLVHTWVAVHRVVAHTLVAAHTWAADTTVAAHRAAVLAHRAAVLAHKVVLRRNIHTETPSLLIHR